MGCQHISKFATGEDRIVRLWNVTERTQIAEITGHANLVWSVAWLPDGTRLATGSGQYASDAGEHHIRIWGLR
jgi:WD40 repeat protein